MSWHKDSYRHSLASKGITTSKRMSLAAKWRSAYPELVRSFPGENPRITEEYVRFRQKDPSRYTQYKTKEINGRKAILGKNQKGEYELQSVLIPKGELT